MNSGSSHAALIRYVFVIHVIHSLRMHVRQAQSAQLGKLTENRGRPLSKLKYGVDFAAFAQDNVAKRQSLLHTRSLHTACLRRSL